MSSDATPVAGSPTVVLVHGAFADGSSFAGVVELLQDAGIDVVVPGNPLRGLTYDSAYIASVLAGIKGPVLACGHSYGGAVLTNAASLVQNVVGLVYICAQSPDEGEALSDLEGTSRDSALGTALVQMDYPTGQGAATAPELIVDRAKFAAIFAGDLPAAQGAVLAAVQRPTGVAAFSDKTHNPAWKTLPSWAVVATGDKAAGADLVLRLAERCGATITKLEGSHLVMISQPDKVAEVINTALAAVG